MKSIHFTGTEQEGDAVCRELCQDTIMAHALSGPSLDSVIGKDKSRITKTTGKVL